MDGKKIQQITADMTVLDIVSQYPATETIFKSYDEQVGECICCQILVTRFSRQKGRFKIILVDENLGF